MVVVNDWPVFIYLFIITGQAAVADTPGGDQRPEEITHTKRDTTN